MKCLKRIVYFILLFLVVFINVSAEEEKNNVLLRWAFIYREQGGNTIKIINPYEKLTSLSSGDMFEIYLEPVIDGYAYIFIYDSLYRLRMIFPEDKDFSDDYYVKKASNILIPKNKTNSFFLDENEGIENIYLLFSQERLLNLETLIKKHFAACGANKMTGPFCREATKRLHDEIRKILLENIGKNIVVEKMVPIAGGLRGHELLADLNSVEVTGESFYGKRIIIEHKE